MISFKDDEIYKWINIGEDEDEAYWSEVDKTKAKEVIKRLFSRVYEEETLKIVEEEMSKIIKENENFRGFFSNTL